MNGPSKLVIVTNTCTPLGFNAADMFLKHSCDVIGIDNNPNPFVEIDYANPNPNTFKGYTHIQCDVSKFDPIGAAEFGVYKEIYHDIDLVLEDIDIVINTAIVQSNSYADITNNLIATMHLTELILSYEHVKNIINVTIEPNLDNSNIWYNAATSGLKPYTIDVSRRCQKWKGRCNEISVKDKKLTKTRTNQIEKFIICGVKPTGLPVG